MNRFDDIIARTDRIIEEAEEIRHESYLLIRDALPASEHDAAEATVDRYRLEIQDAANRLYLELREIECAASKRRVHAILNELTPFEERDGFEGPES